MIRQGLLIVFLLICLYTTGQNSIVVDTSYSPEELVMDFFNDSTMEVSNVTFNGDPKQCGFFWANKTSLGMKAGIILSTGNVKSAEGPNKITDTGTAFSDLSDQDLVVQSGFNIDDAALLEFDFISKKTLYNFNYVFASEEYDEYACSPFADVFGFYIDGPGLNKNIAIIPTTTYPVKINNINQGVPGIFGTVANCTPPNGSLAYSGFYRPNPINGSEWEYDGATWVMTAETYIYANQKYHIKLAVGDVEKYDNKAQTDDSALFIDFSYFGDTILCPKNVNVNVTQIDKGKFDFKTATRYATSYFWDFGDGSTSDLKDPGTHTYSQEGIYKVKFIASNFSCSDTVNIDLNVKFSLTILDSIIKNPSCNNYCDGAAQIILSGGIAPYKYLWSNGAIGNPIIGLCEGPYSITVIDALGDIVIFNFNMIDPPPIDLKVLQSGSPDLGYTTIASVSGGTAPYAFKWSDGYTQSSRTDIKKNQGYSVTVTDINGCTEKLSVKGIINTPTGPKFTAKIFTRELLISDILSEEPNYEIKIFNTIGQNVYKTNSIQLNDLSIDVSNWISGIYFIQLISNRGTNQKTIFIK